MRMFEHVVERQQAAQDDLRRGEPTVPDVLGPERLVDAPGRDPADAEPGAVPRLFDGVLAAPADEAVGERGIRPADEREVLGAEEHAAVEADQRQPLGFAAGPAGPHESVRAVPKMGDHQPAFPAALPAT